MDIRLPACLSLGVAGRDTSWRGLLMHLKQKCSSPDASQFLKTDLEVVHRAWGSIRRRFRRRGVRTPRQLIVNPRISPAVWLVPEHMSKNPSWFEPLRRGSLAILFLHFAVLFLHFTILSRTFSSVVCFSISNTQSIGRSEIYRLRIQQSESKNFEERYSKYRAEIQKVHYI